MKIFIEDQAGNRYECDVPNDTPLNTVAADFFEANNWNQRGRAVVELVDEEDSSVAQRLKGEQTISQANIQDGSVVRIFPESIAAMPGRVARLVADHRDMKDLESWNEAITFITNTNHAPNEYEVIFTHKSFSSLKNDGKTPFYSKHHKIKIYLHSEYPNFAPFIIWETPIWHPNVDRGGKVCLGSLMESYLPGIGLAKIVLMLEEMLLWRNFNALDPMDKEAATWALNQENWKYITEIGGMPIQGPLEDLYNPKNWGHNPENPQSPFRGIEAPPMLKMLWEIREARPRIQFSKI